MPELINGTYVSAIVLALLIPALINCKGPLRAERPLRYKHCHNVILSEAKNLGSACIWRKTEMDQRCLKAWPHASHFVAALALNMTATDEALQRTLFAFDVRLGQRRGDFYLGYFAVGLAGGFQLYFFDRLVWVLRERILVILPLTLR